MASRLFIVRHGNTFDPGETVRRVGGRTDLPLSVSGRAQAEALARHFRDDGVRFTSARTGPLARTRQTAEAILAAQEAPPELAVALFLREIDYGPDENQPESAVIDRIGAEALERWERESIAPPDWRVDPEALVANWQLLIRDLADVPGDHLIVTSNGIARFALPAAGVAGVPGKLATGAFGRIELAADAAPVVAWNIRPA